MADKPKKHEEKDIKKPSVMQGERYLPSAFDDSLSYLEKLNKVIKYLHEYSDLTTDMLERWNEVIEWVTEDGLEEAVSYQLNQWLDDGTLRDVIEDEVFGDFKDQLDKMAEKLDDLKEKIEDEVEDLIEYLENMNQPLDLEVGEDGDHEELADALDYLCKKPIMPRKGTITLLKGYEIKKQIKIYDCDLSNFTVKSKDDVVNVGTDAKDFDTAESTRPVFHVKRGKTPLLDIVVDYNHTKDYDKDVSGVLAGNSEVLMLSGAGFINFSKDGVYVKESKIVAENCDFSNNGNRDELSTPEDGDSDGFGSGLRARNSRVVANKSKANNCGEYGFWIQKVSNAELNETKATNCGHHAMVVSQGSVVTARNSDYRNTLDNSVVATSISTIDLRETDVSDGGSTNVVCQQSSKIYFENGKSNNSGNMGLNVTQFGQVQADYLEANDNDSNGIEVKFGGRCNFRHGQANNNGENGIWCKEGGYVTADHCKANGNEYDGANSKQGFINVIGGTFNNNERAGVYAQRGARITTDSCTIKGNSGDGLRSRNSEITDFQSTVTGNSNKDAKATQTGRIALQRTELSGSGENIEIGSASIIQAFDLDGSSDANIDRNELTVQGIYLANKAGK